MRITAGNGNSFAGSVGRRRFLGILLVGVLAAGVTAVTFTSAKSNNLALTYGISDTEILDHLKYLASDDLSGRLAGTPGAEKAADYLVAKFKEYGLEPGADDSFLQNFNFISGIELGKVNRFALRSAPGMETKEFQLGADYMPKAFSMSGTFDGPGVFAGFGISAPELDYQDYGEISVKDRFVFVLRYGPDGNEPHGKFSRYYPIRYKALTAREKGAKALVLIDDSDDFGKSSLSKLQFDSEFSDSGLAVFAVSQSLAREIFQRGGLDLESLKKRSRAEKGSSAELRGVEFSFQCELHKITKTTTNVVALLRGADAQFSKEFVVLGAHYDHLGLGDFSSLAETHGKEIHNGADDNASGTSGLLEVARVLSKHRSELKRSVIFIAFSAEEEGLIGSKFYVNHPLIPLTQTVAMLNMDMIGRLKGSRLIIGGSGSSPLWRELMLRLNQGSQFDLKFQDDGYGPSDHASFYGKDIPVLFFFTGVHSDYHRPSDDYDKINVEGESRVLGLIAQTVMELSDLESRPVFSKVTSPSSENRSGGEWRAYLGTIPDYGEEVEGVKLSGVRDGSPAAKAGLQANDVIVEFAGIKIKNVYDYTYVLQEQKPGNEVELIVLRNGQRVGLKATLGERP